MSESSTFSSVFWTRQAHKDSPESIRPTYSLRVIFIRLASASRRSHSESESRTPFTEVPLVGMCTPLRPVLCTRQSDYQTTGCTCQYNFCGNFSGAMRRGFGDLIANRRNSVGMTPEQLAARLGRRSKSIVYRLESEEQEPDAETINMLTASLPLSAEELLKAMGVNLSLPLASR